MVNMTIINEHVARDPALGIFLNNLKLRRHRQGTRVPEIVERLFSGQQSLDIAREMGISPAAVSKSATDVGLAGLARYNTQKIFGERSALRVIAKVDAQVRAQEALRVAQRQSTITVHNGCGVLLLPTGHACLFDECDRALIESRDWRLEGKGHPYIIGRGAIGGTERLSRVIMGVPKDMLVDHINGNTLDNRRSNLRIVTYWQNNANKRAAEGGKSKYKGVSIGKRGRWFASITVDGVTASLGRYDTQEEAARAYDTFARAIHGQFACLNFPEEGEQSAHRPHFRKAIA